MKDNKSIMMQYLKMRCEMAKEQKEDGFAFTNKEAVANLCYSLFMISEILVEESKCHISSENACKEIREQLKPFSFSGDALDTILNMYLESN